MISFKEYEPSPKEMEAFRDVLLEEIRASQALET
jgi:hypothetical protein